MFCVIRSQINSALRYLFFRYGRSDVAIVADEVGAADWGTPAAVFEEQAERTDSLELGLSEAFELAH